ncbi:MAG: FAD:protein FMN transferase, partial [Candidatus Dormibacteraeota bacterium]|nr:FAD:protein FMN transferase [Candidatus Dormibacteraeota bacterium]
MRCSSASAGSSSSASTYLCRRLHGRRARRERGRRPSPSFHRGEDGGHSAVQHAEVLPSALVKGWSVDRAAAMLEGAGARNFYLNAGGDVVGRGGAQPGRGWRV